MVKLDNAYLLAFGAHPDDVEFGCGAIIARETQSGRPARIVVCSRGEAATHGTPTQRTAEAERAADLLGASLEFAELGGDAHFEVKLPHVLTLATIIRRVRPSIVLAPTTVGNQHPDHVALGRMVRDAARLARYGGVAELKSAPPHAVATLLHYAVTVEAEPADRSAILVDVSAPSVQSAWLASMEAHASQLKTRDYVELQLARSRVLGLRAGVQRAVALYPANPLLFDSLEDLARSARQF